ncbi:MAG: hypothetical protein PHI28_02895 [Mangrovibacterium sp.]|nr:hypothetical protein [Mangrovibacterium sp.]
MTDKDKDVIKPLIDAFITIGELKPTPDVSNSTTLKPELLFGIVKRLAI